MDMGTRRLFMWPTHTFPHCQEWVSGTYRMANCWQTALPTSNPTSTSNLMSWRLQPWCHRGSLLRCSYGEQLILERTHSRTVVGKCKTFWPWRSSSDTNFVTDKDLRGRNVLHLSTVLLLARSRKNHSLTANFAALAHSSTQSFAMHLRDSSTIILLRLTYLE